MTDIEFVGGPLDGQRVIGIPHDELRREMMARGHWYGMLDLYETRETLYLLYGHIEDDADAPA